MRKTGFSRTYSDSTPNIADRSCVKKEDQLVLPAIEPNFNRWCAWFWAWRNQTRTKIDPAHIAKNEEKSMFSGRHDHCSRKGSRVGKQRAYGEVESRELGKL